MNKESAAEEHASRRTGSSQMQTAATAGAKVLAKTTSNTRQQASETTTQPKAQSPRTGLRHGELGSGSESSSSHETGTALQTGRATASVVSTRPLPLKPRMQVSDMAVGTEQAALMLARLTVHDRSRADWPESRWQMMWEDYLQVLANYPAHELDLGIQHWLLEGKPWFPSLAELIQAMREGHRRWLY